MQIFFDVYIQLKTGQRHSVYPIEFIDFCKYMIILNLMLPSSFKLVGTGATKDFKTLKSPLILNVLQASNSVYISKKNNKMYQFEH